MVATAPKPQLSNTLALIASQALGSTRISGGALGAAVCERFFEEGWIEKDEKTRVVRLTDAGTSALEERLGLVSGAESA